MNYLFEIGMLGVIIGICAIHAKRFRDNIPTGDWFHILWALIYFIPCVVMCLLWGSWWLAAAFVAERMVFFNPVLNKMRGKSFFYTGNTVTGSVIDKILGKAFPIVWGISVIIFVFIQFKL